MKYYITFKGESIFWELTPLSIQFKILSLTVALQDGLWKTIAVLYDVIPSKRLGMFPKLPHNNRVNPGYLLYSFSKSLCVQEASGQAQALDMQLKKGLETS